ncbi:MAG: NAD(P)/FAD-dependent oxidoreductase [Actinomycetota bacterium]|nr:NAD(P)/FAD-dependent oxidoreductase [Actinomycetota bacterium]
MSATVDHEVVVVGAGHNGLICAAYLARAGVDTLVLEAADHVGGCAATVPAVGARVNICNCDHISVRSLPLFDELELGAHGLRYLDLDCTSVGMSWTDDPPAFFFHDVERTLDALALTHPSQVDGYRRYLAAALPAARLTVEIAQQVPTPGNVAGRALRRRLAGATTLLRWARRSVADVHRSYFSSETLMGTAIAGGPAVWGVSPHQKGTGLGALSFAMKHVIQPGRPVGGSGALTDAVAASVDAAGGRIRTGTPVGRLLVEDGRVAGVVTEAGEEIRAANVIVACDPRAVFCDWLDEPPPQARAMVERWRSAPQTEGYESKVDAVIDELPRYRALDDAIVERLGIDPLQATGYVSPTVDQIALAHGAAMDGRVADRPIMLVNLPSVRDETMRTTDGGHVFSLEVLFTPYGFRGGWDDGVEPWRWLERYAELVQPGFLDHVRDWRAMTPDRYEKALRMPKGYAPSFAGGPIAALLGRRPELSRYETPIGGLFLTGAATFPGAGVWGAPGRNAAAVVLDRLERGTIAA